MSSKGLCALKEYPLRYAKAVIDNRGEIKNMRTKRLAMMPVDVLWEYREFKRDEVPAPMIPILQSNNVDEVTEYVKLNGLKPLELSVVNDRALLTDGNLRIVAAKRLGFQEVPVDVT